jgi:hypothetical protein
MEEPPCPPHSIPASTLASFFPRMKKTKAELASFFQKAFLEPALSPSWRSA